MEISELGPLSSIAVGGAFALQDIIDRWFQIRGMKIPTVEQAVFWTDTELAEVKELLLAKDGDWVRNNPDKHPPYTGIGLSMELGDAIVMIMMVAKVAGVPNPIETATNKMRRKVEDLSNGTNGIAK